MSVACFIALNESDKVLHGRIKTTKSGKHGTQREQEAERYLMRAQINTDPVNVASNQSI